MDSELEKIKNEAVRLKSILEESLKTPALDNSRTTPEQRIFAAKNGMQNLLKVIQITIELVDRISKIDRGISMTAGWCFAIGGFVFAFLYLLFVDFMMGVFS